MEKTGWKVIAIIFILLFVLETITVIWITLWAINSSYEELNNQNYCYYDFCSKYPYAEIDENNVCFCYDYDLIGDLIIVDTKIIK